MLNITPYCACDEYILRIVGGFVPLPNRDIRKFFAACIFLEANIEQGRDKYIAYVCREDVTDWRATFVIVVRVAAGIRLC